jgi:predicted RNase H-like HicB family nuclease
MDKLTFIIEQAEEGGYNVRAENEAIFTQAETLEELNLNIAEAIKCHFDIEILPEFISRFVD